MKFGVEVLTIIGPSKHVFKNHDAISIRDSLKVAQELAVLMFPEDPMSSRTFLQGGLVYTNKNDFGDLVVIRPWVETRVGHFVKAPVKKEAVARHGFVFASATDGPEPA